MMKASQEPAWPTSLQYVLRDGRLQGVDPATGKTSLWMYRAVPMAPVVDARTVAESLEPAGPIMAMFDELATMANVNVKARRFARGSYRKFHMLLVNIPQRYQPDRTNELAPLLRQRYPDTAIDRRLLLFGVELTSKFYAGGLRSAIDSVSETILSGGTPLVDFDDDSERVSAAMDRCGLAHLSRDDIRTADSWWFHGAKADTPTLFHPDHVHVFDSVSSVRMAEQYGVDRCTEWSSETVPGTHAITFASVRDLDLDAVEVSDPRSHWVSDLIGADAMAISIRGVVEPGVVTREELRRQRGRFIADVAERYQNPSKMERAEQEAMLERLSAVENMYGESGAGAPPTLASVSIVAAFDGIYRDSTTIARPGIPAQLAIMDWRQKGAWEETWLCSQVRANPNLHDLPAQVVAFSGISSLSFVGDKDGALVGFSELDRQPAYLSPTAASVGDALPLVVVPGATGSGKAETLSTPIPTPSGFTRMGDLVEGDLVLGRDGRPYPVEAAWPVKETPDLYRVTFSDGQTRLVDGDHQWLVAEFDGRNKCRTSKRLTAIETWDRKQRTMTAVERLSDRASGKRLTLRELIDHLDAAGIEHSWRKTSAIKAALDAIDTPFDIEERTVSRAFSSTEFTKTDQVLVFPVRAALLGLREAWTQVRGGNAIRWAEARASRLAAIETLLANPEFEDARAETAPGLARLLASAGAESPHPAMLRHYLRIAGLTPTRTRRQVTIPVRGTYETTQRLRVYDASVAFKSLAVRLSQQYAIRPADDEMEYRVTTVEMLTHGLSTSTGAARFAVRVAAPLDLPEKELPVAPYTFGAWLGDGSSWHAEVSSSVDDLDFMIGQVTADGLDAAPKPSSPTTISIRGGLLQGLREAGVLRNKHIPLAYLRASADQRLALLQGLMDTDGTISRTGTCELSLSDRRLAEDALALIRSLGIKASASWDRPAGYRDETGALVECKDRHRIKFTTDRSVFRLPRKASRIKSDIRRTHKWLYVKDIESVPPDDADYEAVRCITVGSPDRTYLSGAGYLPTSNTMMMLNLATQFSAAGRPTIIWDPKAMPLDTQVPVPNGWATIGGLKPGDKVYGRDGIPCNVVSKSPIFPSGHSPLYRLSLDDGRSVQADAQHLWVAYDNPSRARFDASTPDTRREWGVSHRRWAESLDLLAGATSDSDSQTTYGLLRLLRENGILKWADGKSLSERLTDAGVVPVRTGKTLHWPTTVAAKALATMCALDADAPFGRVVTTAQMVQTLKRGRQSRWALPVTDGIDGPDVELPVDPWLLGAWLGDGHARGNDIAVGDMDLEEMLLLIEQAWPHTRVVSYREGIQGVYLNRDTTRCLYGHDAYGVVDRPSRGSSKVCQECSKSNHRASLEHASRYASMSNPTWIHHMRHLGVYDNKHVPAAYLRASRSQRLALLQGLMDTDGTVKRRGDLRISLARPELVAGVLDLIRGLGYKATIWEGPATLTEPDPETAGATRRRRSVGRQWVITFRTNDQVFRLPRKVQMHAERARRRTDGPRSRWHYVQAITEIESVPVQCIQVDSEDHTYLVGDYVVSHNSGSDHSPTVLAAGGQVFSLDDLLESDGVFDPLRFSKNKAVGVEMAASALMSINPWGDRLANMEVPLQFALNFGVQHGAQCTGEALRIAKQHKLDLPAGLIEGVEQFAASSPQFRAIVGMDPKGESISAAKGITLIKVGDSHLNLPEPGGHATATGPQRVAMALVRMGVYGAAQALSYRHGVLMLDEAWVFLNAGRSEVERLGRLARSQQVLPMLFTQRVTDATNAGLAGYISRGLILPIEDPTEARAAYELFRIEATTERMARITGKATMGGTSEQTTAPNWNSMRALRDPKTGQVIRGAVAVYVDLAGRAIPVHVDLSPDFLALASTNPDDIARRDAAARAAASVPAEEGYPAFF